MENTFNLKKFLAEGVLTKEARAEYYPQELLDMDKEIEDLKNRLDAAIKAKNKAKGDFTKSQPSVSDEEEFSGMKFSDKKSGYEFKELVNFIKSEYATGNKDDIKSLDQSISNELEYYTVRNNGNNGNFPSILIGPPGRTMFVVVLKTDENQDELEKGNVKYIKIGNWYVRPW